MHHFRQRWVREDGVHQFFLGGFQAHGDDEPLEQLIHFGADHARA